MKPKPLKNKSLKSIHDTIDDDIFKRKDIKSAVEWLKAHIPNQSFLCSPEKLIEVIDEAFEDVIKSDLEE